MKKLISLLFFLACLGDLYGAEERICEPNGFIWYKDTQGYRDGSRRYIYHAYDSSHRDLFGRTHGIDFFCTDENDEGQFVVRQELGRSDYRQGLYSREGKCILNPKDGYKAIMKRFRSNGKYYYTIYDGDTHKYGMINDKGQLITPCRFRSIDNSIYKGTQTLDGCLKIETESFVYGLMRYDGSYIIEPAKGNSFCGEGPFFLMTNPQSNINALIRYNGEILIQEAKLIKDYPQNSYYDVWLGDGTKGYFGYNGKWIISPEQGYCEIYKSAGPNKMYLYKVKDNDSKLWGIISSNFQELFPCEFEDIEFIGGNFYKFRVGDSWGVVTQAKKVIIPTSRGYKSIGKYSSIQKTIPFTKNGYKGECNSLGRQISLIKSSSQNGSEIKSFIPKLPNGKYEIVSIYFKSSQTQIPPKTKNNYVVVDGSKIQILFDNKQFKVVKLQSPLKSDGIISFVGKYLIGKSEYKVEYSPIYNDGTGAITIDDTVYEIRLK